MMSACENASASRSGDAAPKTFNVKTLNVKRFGGYSSLEDAVPLSLEDDIRTWKRYNSVSAQTSLEEIAFRCRLIPNPVAGFTASVGLRPLVGLDVEDVWRSVSKIRPHIHPSRLPHPNGACGVRAIYNNGNSMAQSPQSFASMPARAVPPVRRKATDVLPGAAARESP